MLKALKRYVTEGEDDTRGADLARADYLSEVAEELTNVSPIIWETGNIMQIRSLLVLREAELVLAQSQLTGDPRRDWYARNQIGNLETAIADLKRLLGDATKGPRNEG